MLFKTLSKQDAEFDTYLRGTFSKTERALPVKSLNVDSDNETVTFQLVPVADIAMPGFFRLWAQVFRLRSWVYVLFPMFLIITKNQLDEIPWDPWLAVLSAVGALFLTVGAFLQNDYADHVKGVDRVHPLSGSRAIQNGWVTAEATRRWSWFYLVVGALIGLPTILVFPQLVMLLVLPVIVAMVATLFPKVGLKYRWGAEFVVFLLFGPVLTVGFQVATTGQFDLEAIWIGVLTGWHFTFQVHLKNFEALLVNAQAGFYNTMARMGFEKGKRYLELWWVGFLALMVTYQWVYHSPSWFVIFLVVPILLSIPVLKGLRNLKASVGSKPSQVVKKARLASLLVLLLWAFQFCFYWLVIELATPN